MASEIRVNQIQNRSGLSTVTFSDTGVSIAGVTTVGILSATGNSVFSGNLNVTGTISGNVSASGVSTFSSGIVVSAGSTSAPSISPTGDSNTGIFFPSPDTVAIAEGGVEILRVNSSGNLGIGTTDSLNKFEVGNVSGGVTAPDFTVSTVSLGSSVTIGRLSSVGSDNTFFRVRDRVNRTLLSAVVGGVDIGSTDVTTPLTIRNGNLVFSTAGTGIDFSATANSSGTMTSELLSDYEEGTWTPTLSVGTLSVATGYYTKIGRLVTLHFQISGFSNTSSTSAVIIQNIPYANATSICAGNIFGRNINNGTGGAFTGLYINASGLSIYNVSTGSYDNLQHSEINSSSCEIYGIATYQTAS